VASEEGRVTVGQRRQEAALRAYIETGTVKGAAHRLGITERSVRKYLSAYCDTHGYVSIVQAAYWYGRPETERAISALSR
jgi:molybdenum-dependent DNA-binding transcriptional regulator ModE